jgi:stearoyl-CoA desaturase (delta-9 desaturase)
VSVALERPQGTLHSRVLWPYVIAFIVLHLLVPLAFLPSVFTWWGLLLVLGGAYLFGTLGINLCYHRILTHGALQVPKWLEHTLAVLGVCSLQDSPLRWVIAHRLHHQHADEREDPHTPRVSFWWGHMGWLMVSNRAIDSIPAIDKYAPDLLEDPFYRWLHRRLVWLWIYLAHAVIITMLGFGLGWLVTGELEGALGWAAVAFLWGVVVRTVYVWHVTWLVNSASHYWGYKNYQTNDDSRNNWWVALISNGEGWHNNHHAAPRAAAAGHRWWELDVTYWTILLLKGLGLATKVVPVKVPKHRLMGQEPEASESPSEQPTA